MYVAEKTDLKLSLPDASERRLKKLMVLGATVEDLSQFKKEQLAILAAKATHD